MIETLAERFWKKVDKNGPVPAHRPELGPCWLWLASLTKNGYGKISISDGVWLLASRVAFFLHFGRWPFPCVRHRCDNRRCVRWEHLDEGTKKQNAQDMVDRGRSMMNKAKKLSPDDVRAIRAAEGSQADVAMRFGVSDSTVGDILTGRTWRHVT